MAKVHNTGLRDAEGKPIVTGESCTVEYMDATRARLEMGPVEVHGEVVDRFPQKMLSVYIPDMKARGFYYTVEPHKIRMHRSKQELVALAKLYPASNQKRYQYRVTVRMFAKEDVQFSLDFKDFTTGLTYLAAGTAHVCYLSKWRGGHRYLYTSKAQACRFSHNDARKTAEKTRSYLTVHGVETTCTVQRIGR
jgi:hypothetical protein